MAVSGFIFKESSLIKGSMKKIEQIRFLIGSGFPQNGLPKQQKIFQENSICNEMVGSIFINGSTLLLTCLIPGLIVDGFLDLRGLGADGI